ncbi:MAG: hypothetical protein ACTSQX_02715 [Candidatus Heimdallarchaeota archaeon]
MTARSKSKFNSNNAKFRLLLIIFLFIILPLFTSMQYRINDVAGHSRYSAPMEIYSLWNDSSIIVDGVVNFNATNLGSEWSSAAVYNMFDNMNNPHAKILLQNDDTTFYVGIDATEQETDSIITTWGAGVYFDVDHNGELTASDRAIRIFMDSSPSVILYHYDTNTLSWSELEESTLGVALPSGVIGDTSFINSTFKENPHKQYEFKIPFSVFNGQAGKIIGASFETFENFLGSWDEVTWPYIGSYPAAMRPDAGTWGDLFLGEQVNYSQYSIEKNFNIKDSAIGPNNGLFISTGDIDGDLEEELIVVSNRTVTDDDNLIAIYEFVGEDLVQIWNSWTSIHYSKFFPMKSLATYDFDEDGKDEIYFVGMDSRISRLSDWDAVDQEFDSSKNVFIHSPGLGGTISIGDVDQDGLAEIVTGDQEGNVLVLYYDTDKDEFDNDEESPFNLPKIIGKEPIGVYTVKVANMDIDAALEILVLCQLSTKDKDPISRLQIMEYDTGEKKYLDNVDDDLLYSSTITTEDYYGHTIIVEDVDNDGTNETIIVGMNYLRIFGAYSFTDPSPPLEILISDGTSPQMGGGAYVDDVDQDGFNELIIGCNNGTIIIMNITDSGGDVLSASVEWSNDLGSSPGKRSGILAYDIDSDTETEIIFSDNFGQIFILGKSKAPEIEIISPSPGSSSIDNSILVKWSASDDFALHHFDIYVEGAFAGRTSGYQTGFVASLIIGSNDIEVFAFDVNGKNSSATTSVTFSVNAPEVHILTPDNYYETSNGSITITYVAFDFNGDFDYYDIWVNDVKVFGNLVETSKIVTLTLEGTNNITVVGVDLTSNVGKSTIFVIRDTIGPTIDITSPTTNSIINLDEIDVNWIASDALTEIAYFDIFLDNNYFTTTFDNSYLIQLNLDKEYDIEIYAYDTLGNSNFDTVRITRDSVRPIVSILNPISGQFFEIFEIGISWEADDNIGGTGIHHTEITVNQQPKYFGTAEFAIITFETEGLKDVVVTTYDEAGNIASDYISLVIDASNPFITIIQPEDNYTTGLDQVAISWLATDSGSGIQEYNIFVNDILEQTITDEHTTEALVDLPINQTSIIKLQAVDFANKTYNSSITIHQNTTVPTISILHPISLDSYCSVATTNITWDIAGISDLIRFEIYRNDSLIGNLTDISAREFTVDLGNYTIDNYVVLNITIFAITSNPNNTVNDTRFIHLDQYNPFISIITPENNTKVYEQGLFLQWIASDSGSGIQEYIVSINEVTFVLCTCQKNYQYLFFDQGDGNYTIIVTAVDKASNTNNASITVELLLQKPVFSANIPQQVYTNTGIFNFNLSITNPGFGVKYLAVKLDNVNLFNESYESAIRYDPFWELIGITDSDYTVLVGEHDLSIIVIDYFNREVIQYHTIYIDTEDPEFISIAMDDALLVSGSTDIVVDPLDPAGNNHTITLTVSDNYTIESVELIILGDGFSESYDLVRAESHRLVVVVYSITLNLTNLEPGNYRLEFKAIDKAGNLIETSYLVTVSEPAAAPWFDNIANLIYLSTGIFILVIWIVYLSVIIRKRVANRHWQEDVIVVMFIRKTGLTCAYVPYSPRIIQEEQLIGGAMIAIQGVLEEITGEKVNACDVLQLGSESLIMFNGQYSIGIVMVTEVKPKHKSLINKLTKEFEKKYRKPLEAIYYVDEESFRGSNDMIKRYFGPVKVEEAKDENGITSQLKVLNEEFQEIEEEKIAMTARLIDTIDHLALDNKRRFLRIIEYIPKIIISLTEGRINDAENEANTMAMDLDYLLEEDRADAEFNHIVQNMLNISKEFFYGIETKKQNNVQAFESAIKNATKIWFEEIAEKVG